MPIWLSYMTKALEGRAQPEFDPPANLDLVMRRVDKKTGNLASGGSKQSVNLWFKKGTEPQDAEPEKGAADVNNFMMTQ